MSELEPGQPNVFARDALAGRRIFVTGASSGLGRAAATAMATLGATIIANGRDGDRLDATVAGLAGQGHLAIAGALDDADTATDIVKAASVDGALDGVFHAAGIFSVLPAKMTKQRAIDDLFGSSVSGAYGIARAISLRKVMNDGGSVVLMSSVAGVRGNAGLTGYAGAKAAILGMSRALAVELAPRRIRVNALVAGTVDTEMHRTMKALHDDAGADDNLARHPLGYGAPADVAALVVFLMTGAARWITGSAIAIDGGYTA